MLPLTSYARAFAKAARLLLGGRIPHVEGYAVLLTNDSCYWTGSEMTADAAFRLSDGRTLTGELTWVSATGKGTMAGRERAHVISGSHTILWNDYSRLPTPPTLFRWLGVHVRAGG